jgi:hypothetical protein
VVDEPRPTRELDRAELDLELRDAGFRGRHVDRVLQPGLVEVSQRGPASHHADVDRVGALVGHHERVADAVDLDRNVERIADRGRALRDPPQEYCDRECEQQHAGTEVR